VGDQKAHLRPLFEKQAALAVVEYPAGEVFRFTAKRPIAAVGAVLRRLAEGGELVERQPSVRRRAAVYAIAAQQKDA
jgi:hypothetical protein